MFCVFLSLNTFLVSKIAISRIVLILFIDSVHGFLLWAFIYLFHRTLYVDSGDE